MDNEIIEEIKEEIPEQTDKKAAETRPDLSDDVPRCRRIIEAVLFAAGHPMEYTTTTTSSLGAW